MGSEWTVVPEIRIQISSNGNTAQLICNEGDPAWTRRGRYPVGRVSRWDAQGCAGVGIPLGGDPAGHKGIPLGTKVSRWAL